MNSDTNRTGQDISPYTQSINQPHVQKIEEALKHWDKRRPEDKVFWSVPTFNIGQTIYRNEALMRAIHDMEKLGLDIRKSEVLDVGCGQGDGLFPFLNNGFSTKQLHGIDLYADRLATGRSLCPGLDLKEGDASKMPYSDCSFDVVCEQFCFCHIPDSASVKAQIAKEMLRVAKPGGFILIHDWRMGSESRKLYGMSKKRISDWFNLPVVGRYRSQLFPQIGRPVSTHVPFLYPLMRLIPFATGSWVTVLRK